MAGAVDIPTGGGLAGRSAEVGQLRSAVRHVAGGTGRTLVVVGEAGIGKTRVVAEGSPTRMSLASASSKVPRTSWSSGAHSA